MTDADIVKLWLNTPDAEGDSGFADIVRFAHALEREFWRSPKAQHLIGQKARREIELSIIESLVTDPEYEQNPTDEDYWTSLCDKVLALVKEKR